MSETRPILKFSIAALVIGAVGAFGQAYLLHHELADTLPYKVVDAGFYTSIARTGMWLAPLLTVLVGCIFIRRQFWLSLILPVLLTPVVFAVIYKVFHLVHGLSIAADPHASGDFTRANAAEQFYAYCTSLASVGLIIGAILAVILWFIAKPRKLAGGEFV
jgi:hypothetical protein